MPDIEIDAVDGGSTTLRGHLARPAGDGPGVDASAANFGAAADPARRPGAGRRPDPWQRIEAFFGEHLAG